MKTILIGLIKHYTPKKITPQSITYEVDLYGKTQDIIVGWEVKDPEKHTFSMTEPYRKINDHSNVISMNYQTPATIRVCYSMTIDDLNYNVPLTLEETDYVNLLVTQIFQKMQNEKLQVIKSVIDNEVQKLETNGEQIS